MIIKNDTNFIICTLKEIVDLNVILNRTGMCINKEIQTTLYELLGANMTVLFELLKADITTTDKCIEMVMAFLRDKIEELSQRRITSIEEYVKDFKNLYMDKEDTVYSAEDSLGLLSDTSFVYTMTCVELIENLRDSEVVEHIDNVAELLQIENNKTESRG